MQRIKLQSLPYLLSMALLCLFVLSGCGSNAKAPILVLVTPGTAIVLETNTQTFTANVSNDSSNQGVTWSLSCSVASCGTLSGNAATSVTYTAPIAAKDLTVIITGTSVADTKQTGTATITVPAITVAVAPGSPNVKEGTTQVFTATVGNTFNKSVNWTLARTDSTTTPPTLVACSPGCGTLSNVTTTSTGSTVTYNAPATAPPPPPNDLKVTVAPGAESIAINLAQSFRAVVDLPVTITATSAEDPTMSASTTLTVPDQAGVTWKLTQGSPPAACSPACGTLTNASTSAVTYNAPAAVPATAAVTLTATSVTDTTRTGGTTITIVATSASNNLLSGQYAFLLGGFDDATHMQVAIAGSLTADGKGNISAGVEDINGPATSPLCLPSCPLLNAALTGTYSMGADNRGILSITNSVGTTKYALAVGGFNSSGVATTASLIEFDDTTGATGTRGSGIMLLQDATAFSQTKITGPFAVGISGQDSTGGRIATVGRFDADGAGNFTNGAEDINDAGTATTNGAFTGTYAAPDANGRATGTLSAGGSTIDIVFYIVSANALLLETTDAEATAGLQSGNVLAQTSTTFTNSSLSGNAVFEEAGVVSSALATASVKVGAVTFTSSSTSISGTLDTNSAGVISSNQALASGITYALSANGRVTTTGGSGTLSGAVLYLVDTNKGFILESGANTSFGTFEAQSGSLSAASISGNYYLGTAPPAVTASSVSSGVTSADGVGTINLASDISASNGTLTTDLPQSFSFTVAAANGRTSVGTAGVAYVISPTKFFLIDVSTTDTAPTITVVAQ